MPRLTTTTSHLILEPVVVPASVDAADAASFTDMVDLRNAAAAHLYGTEDHALPAEDLLPGYRPTPYGERRAWLVRDEGVAVARFVVDLPTTEDRHVAMVQLEVHPEHRGRGVGRFAADHAERIVRGLGRTEVRTWVAHEEQDGPRLTAPTGVGDVPAADPGARMLTARGYRLGQVERFSALDLDDSTDATLVALRDRARAAAGPDHRTVSWTYPTPDALIDQYAAMKARMSTDAPQGELVEEAQEWDAARVREALEQPAAEAGRTVLVGAVEHVPSGRLVAYSELVGPVGGAGTTDQEDTLVLTEHRGHRLGLLVKAETLLAWRRVQPSSPRVTTFNAEENTAMIRVNERLGFRVVVREGAWRRTLD